MVENYGEIVQVIGPVLDIRFTDYLPKLYNAINIPFGDGFITAADITVIYNILLGSR